MRSFIFLVLTLGIFQYALALDSSHQINTRADSDMLNLLMLQLVQSDTSSMARSSTKRSKHLRMHHPRA
ncbi:hypothetical protein MJO29_008506 [Puccinia striiformis f. sp. tritici]|nr:hypothetical protein Pst134EB_016431 [Puccinia striiformis f. sp. tritici]KAI7952875.1 hypothetical protein MJO29_008506 [Puccinia striiformis f. sp. tritici]